MITTLIVVLFSAIMIFLWWSMENNEVYVLILILIFGLTIMSVYLGDNIRQDMIEKAMIKHNIVEYKANTEKNIKTVLKDSTKFNEELYKQCIK